MIIFKTLSAALFSLIILFSIYTLSISVLFPPINSGGFFYIDSIWNSDIFRNVILTITTYIGILTQVVFDEISSQKGNKIKIYSILKKIKHKKNLWISLIISPIVLVMVFKGIEQIPDNFVSFLFAYQNGFFFKSIINGLK